MTKLEVLHRLRQANGAYVSSSELCSELKISRNSVWKAVNALRKEGYLISASTNQGYRMNPTENQPDFLTESDLTDHLHTRILGRKIILLQTTASTNSYARALADDPDNEGLTIFSELQTAGRSKSGRYFESKEGGLYFSIILQPQNTIVALPKLRQTIIDAVRNALSQELGIETEFLPPNELFVQGKKICGILSEVRIESETESISSMISGIGIYCNGIPFPAEDKRISASQYLGKKVNRAALAAAILNDLEGRIY